MNIAGNFSSVAGPFIHSQKHASYVISLYLLNNEPTIVSIVSLLHKRDYFVNTISQIKNRSELVLIFSWSANTKLMLVVSENYALSMTDRDKIMTPYAVI